MLRRTFCALLSALSFVWGKSLQVPADKEQQSATDSTSTVTDFVAARRRVCNTLQQDIELYDGYVANIAMLIYDNSTLEHAVCERLAKSIMHLVFETPDTGNEDEDYV